MSVRLGEYTKRPACPWLAVGSDQPAFSERIFVLPAKQAPEQGLAPNLLLVRIVRNYYDWSILTGCWVVCSPCSPLIRHVCARNLLVLVSYVIVRVLYENATASDLGV